MQQAWMPQSRRARRYLDFQVTFDTKHSFQSRHTVDKRIEDRHGAIGDTSIRVDLLQDYIDALVRL